MRTVPALIVLGALGFFGVYGVAPMFGLDELYPAILGENGVYGRWILFGLMVLGGVLYLIERRRGARDD